MITVMRSHIDNRNGHWGVEFFSRWYVGFYYYPRRRNWQYSITIIRVRKPTKTEQYAILKEK